MNLSALFAYENPRLLWVISCLVVVLHFFFLIFLSIDYQPVVNTSTMRRVVVKTVSFQTKPKNAVAEKPASKPAKKEISKEIPAEKSAPKKQEKPAAKKSTPSKNGKPVVKQENIRKIQENLSKINTKSVEKMPEIALSTETIALSVDSLPTEDPLEGGEFHYRDQLAQRLRMYLTLPERGEVVIKLLLNRSGRVVRLTIMSASSEINKKYVEQKVAGLTFAGFGNFFSGEQQHTFTIALRSE